MQASIQGGFNKLLNYVWGDEVVGDEVVRTHIKNLRTTFMSLI